MQQEKKNSVRRYKMLVICPHPENMVPGQRLKYEQYFNHFRENNIDVVVKPFMNVRFQEIVYKKGYFFEKIYWTLVGYWKRFFLLFSIRKYDLSYIFLWVTPFGPPLFEWMVCKLSKKIIYDIDDLVYLPESKSSVNNLISGLVQQARDTHTRHPFLWKPDIHRQSHAISHGEEDRSALYFFEFAPVRAQVGIKHGQYISRKNKDSKL